MSDYFSIKQNIYPELLRRIHKPPPRLYYRGKLAVLKKTAIAVVGTRNFSAYGEFITEKIIEELAAFDFCIVSGLARGIDTIAHKAALANDLSTIAVLGSGLGKIYPPENTALAEELSSKNLLLSEHEDEVEPRDYHFPQRNRIISALSIATLVIEAPEKSGALITARFALEQNREIFTVPGDADREQSIGPLRLLQRGAAYPVSSGQEIIEVLKEQGGLFPENKNRRMRKDRKTAPPESILNLSTAESQVFQLLQKHRPTAISTLMEKTTLPTEKILIALSLLEIKSLIRTKDGKYLRTC